MLKLYSRISQRLGLGHIGVAQAVVKLYTQFYFHEPYLQGDSV